MPWYRLLALALAASLLLTNCGGSKSSTVQVRLREWEVEAVPEQTSPGKVKFEIANTGGVTHQFMVVKSDAPPSELPLKDGAIDESKVNVVKRAEPLAPGESQTLELSLSGGKYVLVCALTAATSSQDSGAPAQSHYLRGMHTGFQVGK